MFFKRIIDYFKESLSASSNPVTGFAWYREEQWPLLQKVSIDGARLEPTYQQWLNAAQTRYDKLTAEGTTLQKVVIDVVDMAAWCSEMGREVDSTGRAAYVVYRLHQQKMSPKTKLTE